MQPNSKFQRWLYRPEGILVISFGALVLLGTIALRTPFCQADKPVGVLDALFTSTSAVCVTGLITRDTATDFSGAGQTGQEDGNSLLFWGGIRP